MLNQAGYLPAGYFLCPEKPYSHTHEKSNIFSLIVGIAQMNLLNNSAGFGKKGLPRILKATHLRLFGESRLEVDHGRNTLSSPL